jgi:hypothetical protein
MGKSILAWVLDPHAASSRYFVVFAWFRPNLFIGISVLSGLFFFFSTV